MVPMPAVIVLIVCKVAIIGPPDQNAGFTGSQNLDWATENAMMVCRRQEVQVTDAAADQGADPQPFNQASCMRSAMMLGPNWDAQHRNSRYRFWRVACPVPIMDDNGTPGNSSDDRVIGYALPDCGHRDVVRCEIDTAI